MQCFFYHYKVGAGRLLLLLHNLKNRLDLVI